MTDHSLFWLSSLLKLLSHNPDKHINPGRLHEHLAFVLSMGGIETTKVLLVSNLCKWDDPFLYYIWILSIPATVNLFDFTLREGNGDKESLQNITLNKKEFNNTFVSIYSGSKYSNECIRNLIMCLLVDSFQEKIYYHLVFL